MDSPWYVVARYEQGGILHLVRAWATLREAERHVDELVASGAAYMAAVRDRHDEGKHVYTTVRVELDEAKDPRLETGPRLRPSFLAERQDAPA